MISKLTQDLSAITGIPKLTLDNLVEKADTCIAHSLYETFLKKEVLTEIDIGIGMLYIKLEGNQIKYKFIPSEKLEQFISFSLVNKESPLILDAEKALKTRVEKTYKELI